MAELTYHQDPDVGPLPAALRRLFGRLQQRAREVRLWRARLRQRFELIELPPHLLFDIGLTRADVEEEARKLPWQQPALCAHIRVQPSSEERPDAQDQ
jgi:uncharacterized protein YjiS (DUF1127 family)